MTNTIHEKYDFDAAARVAQPIRVAINTWTQKAVELFVEQWEQFSQTEITAVPTNVDCRSFGTVQQQWPKLCCGVAVSFGNEEITGIVLASNSELLVLLLDVLGGTPDEASERPLTFVENDLANLIFEAFASSFGQSWQGQEALEFEIAQLEDEPTRSRMFAESDNVILTGLKVQISEVTAQIHMALLLEQTRDKLGIEETVVAQPSHSQPLDPESIAQLTVSISAELGKARINMSDLVDVQPGDVLVLDQSVQAPVTVLANGQAVFRAWPGKRSSQQAIQIASIEGDSP